MGFEENRRRAADDAVYATGLCSSVHCPDSSATTPATTVTGLLRVFGNFTHASNGCVGATPISATPISVSGARFRSPYLLPRIIGAYGGRHRCGAGVLSRAEFRTLAGRVGRSDNQSDGRSTANTCWRLRASEETLGLSTNTQGLPWRLQ